MSRVEINADGRHVVVDHVGDLSYLIEQAMDAWRAIEPHALHGAVPVRRAWWWAVKSWWWWVVYTIRPYDMLADRRRWFWQRAMRCGWPL